MDHKVQASKKRSMAQKVVVSVKLGESDGKKHKSEGPPSDCWSWRKYGQKPIKGSPHPRGYYRCSTSKGCSAKKQVERSKTDSSLLIITYTSTHNHPGPQLPATNNSGEEPVDESTQASMAEDHSPAIIASDKEPEEEQKILKDNEDEDMFAETSGLTANYDVSSSLWIDGKPLSYPHLMNFSTAKSEENDFYDELGELPPTSSFNSFFVRNNFFQETVLVNFPGSV